MLKLTDQIQYCTHRFTKEKRPKPKKKKSKKSNDKTSIEDYIQKLLEVSDDVPSHTNGQYHAYATLKEMYDEYKVCFYTLH